MSKPDKPGELQDVEVQAISMVSKAANGEKFKIFKSVEDEPEEKEEQVPEVVKKEEKDERGLFNALKNFFMGGSKVEKGEVIDKFNHDKRSQLMQLNEAYFALKKVLKLEEFDEAPETNTEKITEALDDFRVLGARILLGTEPAAIEKAGRKISNSRLARLREMVTTLNEIISEVEDDGEDVKIVRSETELTKEEINEVIKEALSPVMERIEKIENARGFSNKVPEEKTVEKSGDDFWGNIF